MSFDGLHETVVKDVIDIIKDGISQAEDIGTSLRRTNNVAKMSSLNKATEGLILVFPVVCTTTVSLETASLLTKAVERKATSLLQIAFAAFNITNYEDAVSFVKQFHTNVGTGKMSVDKFIDAMDSIASESAGYSPDMDRRAVRSVLEEFKQMECYFEEDLSENSINDYKVINRNGSTIVTEKVSDTFNNIDGVVGGVMRKSPNQIKDEKEEEKNKFEREKFKHQKEKDQVSMTKDITGMQKDMVGAAKDALDMMRNQIMPSDIKKANEMVPTMMAVNFTVKNGDDKITIANQAIIGVKAKLYPASSNDVVNKIITKNADSNAFLKLMRVSTRELNFVKDFLLAIDDAKLAAVSGSVKGSETNKLLKILERRALKGKIRKKFNMNNAYKAISTLIISKEEADYIKQYNNIDVYNPAVIRKIMESLNFMMFIIADDSEEAANIIMDTGEDMYETISYTHLDREASDGSYKKAINLMTKVVR